MKMLRLLREKSNKTQLDIAKYLGCERSTYTKYETGKSEPPFEVILKLSRLYGETPQFVMGDTSCHDQPGNGVKIPVLGNVAAGIPIEAITDIIDYEEIDAEMASRGEYFGLRIKGSSMEPRMMDGDVVIVRRQDAVENGETAVVLVNGDSATVKKVRYLKDGLQLLPTNPVYDPMYFSAADVASLPVRIIGRVVELRAKY